MLRVISIDDEPLALDMMKYLLKNYSEVELVGAFTNYNEAVAKVDFSTIHVAFIDIDLADVHGIDVAGTLKELYKDIDIVFVTAHAEYALKAFGVAATDYLLKPVLKQRLDQTIERLYYKHALKQPGNDLKKIKVRCFGQFEVLDQQDKLIQWRTAKTKELAAFLFYYKGKFVSKDLIFETLWGAEQKSERILYTTVHYLRSAFKNLGHEDLVVSKNSNYKIELEFIELDTVVFENNMQQATIEAMERAERVYTGDYFELEGYTWAYEEKYDYLMQYEQILEKLCKHFAQQQEYDQVIRYANKFLKNNPFSEKVHTMLIQAYCEKKEFLELEKYYEKTKNLYKKELSAQVPIAIRNEYLKAQNIC